MIRALPRLPEKRRGLTNWLGGLWVLILMAPASLALTWTVYPTLQALYAIIRFEPATAFSSDVWLDPGGVLQTQRHIQKHFRNYAVHIPLEDIYIPPDDEKNPDPLSLLMQKACGRGKLYVWIPFKLNLPAIGEKVFEWCWKPPIKTL